MTWKHPATVCRGARAAIRRAFVVVSLVSALPLLAMTAPAYAAAPQTFSDVSTAYSADGQWRATLDANTYNFFAVKSIGATVSVQHREWVCSGPFCWGGHSWQWVDRPASYAVVRNVYTPFPPQYGTCDPANPTRCAPPAPPRACAQSNTQSLGCYDWAFFFTFTIPSGTPGSPGAPLNIKGVRSTASVSLPNGQNINLGPVDDAFWF